MHEPTHILAPSAGRAAFPPASGTVLLVDDHRVNRLVCKGCLEREGYCVREAEDGRAALDAVAKERPDAILMDVMMPGMDGLDCTRRLKSGFWTRDIPIIMVSARTDARDIVAGLEAGADEYLTKPIRPLELSARVRTMVRLSRERRDLLRSYELRDEQVRVLTAMLEFCRRAGPAQTLDDVLDHTLAAVAEVMRSRRVSLMLPNEDRTCLTVVRQIGLDQNVARRIEVPVGSATAGRVFASGRAVVVNNAADRRRHDPDYDSPFFASVPLLSAPLGCMGDVVGVVNVTERVEGRPFEPHELEYIELLAGIAGAAMRAAMNAQARDQARDLIVVAMAKLAEHRDHDTARHVERVTLYAQLLAQELRQRPEFSNQIDLEFIRDLQRAAPLHDIGKVAIPDHILRKPGKLTPGEMAVMRTHTQVGAEAMQAVVAKAPDVTFLKMAADIIRAHHEWYNGFGYPLGLQVRSIPLAARIVALADVYDALTTHRVYKSAVSHEEARKIIRCGCGSQFDPDVVEAFLRCENGFRQLATEMSDPGGPTSRENSHSFA